MYTNTLAWNFGNKLAARADISLAYSPFSSGSANSPASLSNKGGDVFLRNAEIMYQPRENLRFHLAFQRSPYGYYASPFGYYGSANRGFHSRY
ncbi:MAG: hypothetical protein HKN13_07145 [Rhodothermales bacterium]|nr:hypothetical protein [Rhodothermales bacterium]